MTFLEIANDVAVKVRLPELTNCFSSSDRNAKAIKVSIIDAAERSIFRKFDWSFLIKQHEFTTGNDVEDYEMPAGYNRSISDTFWNETTQRKIIGPVSASTWAMHQNDAYGVSIIDKVCRIMSVGGDKRFFLLPLTAGGETITYYYVSDRYVLAGHAYPVLSSSFSGDDDNTLLDDELIAAGALYRTLRILGLDYGEERYEFTTLLKERTSHDGGAEILNLVHSEHGELGVNVPLTGMG